MILKAETSVMSDLEAFRESKFLIFWWKLFLFPDYACGPWADTQHQLLLSCEQGILVRSGAIE